MIKRTAIWVLMLMVGALLWVGVAQVWRGLTTKTRAISVADIILPYKDPDTGCEYLVMAYTNKGNTFGLSGITPRLDKDGYQICHKVDTIRSSPKKTEDGI